MNFPAGHVAMPNELLLSGMSGPKLVQPPEQPTAIGPRMTDAALFRLADNLATLMESFANEEEKPGGVTPSLREYVELLTLQVEREIMRRM